MLDLQNLGDNGAEAIIVCAQWSQTTCPLIFYFYFFYFWAGFLAFAPVVQHKCRFTFAVLNVYVWVSEREILTGIISEINFSDTCIYLSISSQFSNLLMMMDFLKLSQRTSCLFNPILTIFFTTSFVWNRCSMKTFLQFGGKSGNSMVPSKNSIRTG